MDFGDLLFRYFGQSDIDSLTSSALEAGTDRLRVDFGMEKDAGRHFAMWALLFMMGHAPDLDVAFKTPEERDAARNFMDMVDGMG